MARRPRSKRPRVDENYLWEDEMGGDSMLGEDEDEEIIDVFADERNHAYAGEFGGHGGAEVPFPAMLRPQTLDHHQRIAVSGCLASNRPHEGYGVLLWYGMGSGKTLTSLSLASEVLRARDAEHVVLLCPKSVVSHIGVELNRHFGVNKGESPRGFHVMTHTRAYRAMSRFLYPSRNFLALIASSVEERYGPPSKAASTIARLREVLTTSPLTMEPTELESAMAMTCMVGGELSAKEERSLRRWSRDRRDREGYLLFGGSRAEVREWVRSNEEWLVQSGVISAEHVREDSGLGGAAAVVEGESVSREVLSEEETAELRARLVDPKRVMVIIDEVHRYRNLLGMESRYMRAGLLRCSSVVGMTGTPVFDRAGGLASVLSVVGAGLSRVTDSIPDTALPTPTMLRFEPVSRPLMSLFARSGRRVLRTPIPHFDAALLPRERAGHHEMLRGMTRSVWWRGVAKRLSPRLQIYRFEPAVDLRLGKLFPVVKKSQVHVELTEETLRRERAVRQEAAAAIEALEAILRVVERNIAQAETDASTRAHFELRQSQLRARIAELVGASHGTDAFMHLSRQVCLQGNRKISHLIRQLATDIDPETSSMRLPALVFSSFRTSGAEQLRQAMLESPLLDLGPHDVAVIDGDTSAANRAKIVRRFNRGASILRQPQPRPSHFTAAYAAASALPHRSTFATPTQKTSSSSSSSSSSSKSRAAAAAADARETDPIKILLCTPAGGEGIDLRQTRQVHLLEPHFNHSRIEQAAARAVRRNSHTVDGAHDRETVGYDVHRFEYYVTGKTELAFESRVLQHEERPDGPISFLGHRKWPMVAVLRGPGQCVVLPTPSKHHPLAVAIRNGKVPEPKFPRDIGADTKSSAGFSQAVQRSRGFQHPAHSQSNHPAHSLSNPQSQRIPFIPPPLASASSSSSSSAAASAASRFHPEYVSKIAGSIDKSIQAIFDQVENITGTRFTSVGPPSSPQKTSKPSSSSSSAKKSSLSSSSNSYGALGIPSIRPWNSSAPETEPAREAELFGSLLEEMSSDDDTSEVRLLVLAAMKARFANVIEDLLVYNATSHSKDSLPADYNFFIIAHQFERQAHPPLPPKPEQKSSSSSSSSSKAANPNYPQRRLVLVDEEDEDDDDDEEEKAYESSPASSPLAKRPPQRKSSSSSSSSSPKPAKSRHSLQRRLLLSDDEEEDEEEEKAHESSAGSSPLAPISSRKRPRPQEDEDEPILVPDSPPLVSTEVIYISSSDDE